MYEDYIVAPNTCLGKRQGHVAYRQEVLSTSYEVLPGFGPGHLLGGHIPRRKVKDEVSSIDEVGNGVP